MADSLYHISKITYDSVQHYVILDTESIKSVLKNLPASSTFSLKDIISTCVILLVALFSTSMSVRLANKQRRFTVFTEWSATLRNNAGTLLSALYQHITDTTAYGKERGSLQPDLIFSEKDELSVDKLYQNNRDSEAEFLNAMIQVNLLLESTDEDLKSLVKQCDNLRNNINNQEDGKTWTQAYSDLTSNFLIAINDAIERKRKSMRV